MLVTIVLAGLCAGALLVDRSLQFFIGRDSSLFLYIARRVQEGAVPYRDVWDHKPPLIYYLDVIGLALADRGIPGMAVVEFAALFAAAMAGFFGLRRTLGVAPALFGTVAWTTAIAVMLDGGNRPEEYALPLQLTTVALFLAERRHGPSRWRWIGIGVAAGLAVMLKPTVLGMWVAIYAAEAARAAQLRSLRAIARPLVLGALGAALVTLPAALYLAASGAGADFVDQVIRYNVEYSRSSLSDRVEALAGGVELTLFSGLFPIAAAAWLTAIVRLARGSARAHTRPLLVVAMLAFPLDFFLASATGRPYREYFLGCLAVQGILAAIAADALRPALERMAVRLAVSPRVVLVTSFAFGAFLFASAIPAVASYRQETGPNEQERTRPLATTYVIEHTASTDRVLFWGAEGGLNYTTGRRSPTRYAYQYALYMRDYQRPAQIDELLSELERDPPALIVDASPATLDVPPLDHAARDGWTLQEPKYTVLPEMDRLFLWIEAHYLRVAEVGSLNWPIYELRDRPRLGVDAPDDLVAGIADRTRPARERVVLAGVSARSGAVMCDASLIDPKPRGAFFTLVHDEVALIEVCPQE